VHELVTNAVKYGALGQPQALLVVTWSVEPSGQRGEPWLHIHWHESGVAMPPERPARRGQGRDLIEQALPYQLSARTSFTLGPDGVRCSISVPASDTMGGAA
jgi:two-component sensor histidine kinase